MRVRFRHRIVVLAVLAAVAAAALSPWAIRRWKARPAWQIEHGEPAARAWAVRELSKAGASGRALSLIEGRLGDSDPAVRCTALEALARARAPASLPKVLALAGSEPVLAARLKALETLGDLGGTEARAFLLRRLDDDVPDVRAAAAGALGRCGAREDVARLKEMLLQDPVPAVAERAREALSALDWKPEAAAAAALPEGAKGVCFEAVQGIPLQGNFEIAPGERFPDAEAGKKIEGAGRWIRDPEGAGGNHDWLGGMNGSIDIGQLRYTVLVPKAGRWVLWARAWWMDKCGDTFQWRIDKGRWNRLPDQEDRHVEARYRSWFWDHGRAFSVKSAGAHSLEIQAREDGIRFDLCALLPEGETPGEDLRPNFEPLAAAEDGASLSLSRASEVLPSSGPLEGSLFVQRLGRAPLDGTVEITAEDGTLAPAGKIPILLEGPERIREIPFRVSLPADAPARERILLARFVPRSGSIPEARRALILSKPWPWDIAGPFEEGRDASAIPPDAWKRFPPEAITNAYKTIDFEKAFAPGAHGRAFLRARFEALEDFDGILFLNADDRAEVRIDGEPAIRTEHEQPAEGFLERKRLRIRKGIHRVEAEVGNQGFPDGHPYFETQNYWLFRLRLRKDNHVPAPVRGLPWR